jgi:hypothetical protein
VWDTVLQGRALTDEEYEVMHPLIAKDLCNNYHREEGNGQTVALVYEKDYGQVKDWSFKYMKDHFIAIQRRAGGGDMREHNEEIRKRVLLELNRVTWPNKNPDIGPWCVVPVPGAFDSVACGARCHHMCPFSSAALSCARMTNPRMLSCMGKTLEFDPARPTVMVRDSRHASLLLHVKDT